MLLPAYLERAANLTPDAVAVVTDGERLTFAELDGRANAVAAGLQMAGVAVGDRVAIHLDNCMETVVAVWATLKAGAAILMVNPSVKGAKLEHLLNHSEASAIILPAAKLGQLEPTLASIGSLHVVVTVGQLPSGAALIRPIDFGELSRGPAGKNESRAIDQDLACLLYTSGSTGEPKGVMLTHANVRTAIDAVAQYLRLTSSDVLMNVLPLSFGYGLTQLFSATKVGATFVLEKGMAFPHVTLSRIASEGVTGFAMVPTIAAVLLRLDLSRYDLSSLRYLTNAGAGLPPEHARQIRQAIPHADLFLMYGQTECLRISYLDPSEVDRRPDSVGRGMPNQQLSVVDPSGRQVGPGEVGELIVRGSHVMRGYWRMPVETAAALTAGRYPGEVCLRTGDLFRVDADGFLHFVARGDDIIKCKGEKVSPREVENVLYRLVGVEQAAVVGVADAILGQAVKAVIVVRPDVALSAETVQRHCAASLEDFMVPSIVEFRDALPLSDNGKVLKASLRA
jgi:long-chain acyl-CoA synthetase